MAAVHPLRRALLAVTATALLLGGVVASAGAAGAVETPNGIQGLPLISLNNDTAQAGTDCPAGDGAYWHFVLAPNDGSAAFYTLFLRLTTGPDTTEDVIVTGDQIIPNGTQTDNVFVAVPAGHSLTDLVALGSFATYTGTAPNEFNLSHTCAGAVGTTTTTAAPTTTSTAAPAPTTTEAPDSTTTTEAPESTTTTEVAVLGAVQTTSTSPAPVAAPAAAPAEVAGAVQVNGDLPYTGTSTSTLVAAGLGIVLAGVVLVGLARMRGRLAGDR